MKGRKTRVLYKRSKKRREVFEPSNLEGVKRNIKGRK